MAFDSDLQRLLDTVRTAAGHAALPDVPAAHPGAFERYTFDAEAPAEALVEQFDRELTALSGHVHRARNAADAASTVLGILSALDARTLLAWEAASPLETDAAAALRRAGIELVAPRVAGEPQARKRQLREIESIAAGLTGARAALADTGSLVLVSGPGRARLASLLPPVHVALVETRAFYPSLPAFLDANPAVLDEGCNVVIVTGPSRTADIEMTLSWGVHGPKHVHAIVVG
jgi:L-lactate dehydrogenase complex protein LldG